MENSQENQPRPWTWAENKAFEVQLAGSAEHTPETWRYIAGVLPGRSPEEVEEHYNKLVDDISAIEAGVVPLPKYSDDVASGDVAAVAVRKKGLPWSIEEQKLFLNGLKIYGKGDWRNISRNCVKTRTPTQVASHAQKYFNRKNLQSNTRRSSIHDIILESDDEDSLLGPENIANTNNEQVSNGLVGDHISDYMSFSSHQVPNQVALVENNTNGSLGNNCEINLYHQGDSNENDTMMICHPTLSQNQFSMGINNITINTDGLSNSQMINLQNGDVFMGNGDVNYPYVSFASGDGPSNLSPAQYYNKISHSDSMRQVNGGHSNSRLIDLQYGDVFISNGNGNNVNNVNVNLLDHQTYGNHAGSSNSSPPHHSGSTSHIIAHHPGSSNYVSYSPPADHYKTNINQGSMRHIPNSQMIVGNCYTDSVHNGSALPCVIMTNGQVNANGADVSNSLPDHQLSNEHVPEHIENSTTSSRM